MSSTRFVLVGGFLGAGKTTLIARLARHYQAQGHRVGVVTNDQAAGLVDTQALGARQLPVVEVAGACFCCRFDDLIAQADRLRHDGQPDVIFAEPVGSCADLVATVIQPLKDMFRDRFVVAPYVVVCKAAHGLDILRGGTGGFGDDAAYVFRKQLEEADAIVVNRIDDQPAGQVQELTKRLADFCPATPVLPLSAKTGEGFAALPSFLDQPGAWGRKLLAIDYDRYAAGEAELGWLNLDASVTLTRPCNINNFLLDLVGKLRTALHGRGEVAHLKVAGTSGGATGVVSLIAGEGNAEVALAAEREAVGRLDLMINARVALDPDELRSHVERALTELSGQHGAVPLIRQAKSLRPGRPVPTHRFTLAVV